MLNCVPQERIATVNFVATFAQVEDSTTWYNWLSQGPIYIHFTSLVELLKDEPTSPTRMTHIKRIVAAWEEDILRDIGYTDMDELPAIIKYTNSHCPDNAYVYCRFFREYVELRKHFGIEDLQLGGILF